MSTSYLFMLPIIQSYKSLICKAIIDSLNVKSGTY